MSTSPSKKGIWKQIEPWISREKYFGTTISILIGVFFIYHGFSRDSINSDKDLYEVTGTLNEYSFEESDSFRRNNIYYYLWLTEYSNRFQIKADFANYFNRRKFELLSLYVALLPFTSLNSTPAFSLPSLDLLAPQN